MQHFLKITLFLFLVPALPGVAQPLPWAASVDQLIDAYNESSFPFNGVVLLYDETGVLYRRAEGYANLELKVPLQMGTRFRIASVSKQFAGFLAWQLVEEGLLDMRTPIARYVTRLEGTPAGTLTMHDLLTHSAGLPPDKYIWDYVYFKRQTGFTLRDFFDLIARDSLHFAPGTRYEYCNTCYVLAAATMEQITDRPYPALLRDKILAPLDMTDTGLDSIGNFCPKRAYYYDREYGKGLRPASPIDLAPLSAAGGMYSTAEDLQRWGRALFFTDQLLSPRYRSDFFQPFLNDYAFGLKVLDKPLDREGTQVPAIEHDGLIEGSRAYFAYLPEKSIGIVLLSNFGCSFPFADFQRRLIKTLYGKPFQPPKKSLAYQFSVDLQQHGAEYAATQFRQHLPDTARYQLSQSKLNEYGFFLLRRDRFGEALLAFRLNAEAFPDSWSAHNSLAEAYRKAEQPRAAIRHYRRAVELNPRYTNGKRMLEKLERIGGKD